MSNSDTFMEVIELLDEKNMSPKEMQRFFARAHLTTTQALLTEDMSLASLIVGAKTGEVVTITDNIDTVEMNQKIIEALQKNMLELSPTVSMQA